MSEIFDNAVTSIRMGIEDFETDDDDRMMSAARNYYAGLLLLAKECLVRTAPAAEAMTIVGARFKPIPNDDGGVDHVVDGYTTVDLGTLKRRFKDFKLPWPTADISKLQQYRNNLEHYHLAEPIAALREAIASSFPMIVDFFKVLDEDPQHHLTTVWDVMVAERATFDKLRLECDLTWNAVAWPAPVNSLDRMSCPNCQSSLIAQDDPANPLHADVEGRCVQCNEEIDHNAMMTLIVNASYETDAYIAAKEGQEPLIGDCPQCGESAYLDAYIDEGKYGVCFACGTSVDSVCDRCHERILIDEYEGELCGSCTYAFDKIMAE